MRTAVLHSPQLLTWIDNKMPIKKIPRTRQRVLCSKFNTEISAISDSGNDTLDFEDKVLLGRREEPDGTVVEGDQGVASFQKGVANKLQGTEAGTDGAKFSGVTSRGNNPQTTFPRRKFVHFD